MRTLALHSLILPAAVNNSRDGIKSRKQLHFCAPPQSGSTCSYDRPTLAESSHCEGIKGDEMYIHFFPDWPLFTRLLLLVSRIESLFVPAHGSRSGREGGDGTGWRRDLMWSIMSHPARPVVGQRAQEIAISHQELLLEGLEGGGITPPGVSP